MKLNLNLTILISLAFALSAKATINLGQIMPLGDSITEGQYFPSGTVGNGPVSDYPGGYRQNFYTDLNNSGFKFQFIGSQKINPSPTLTAANETAEEGHPGFTSTNLYGSYASVYDNLPSYFSGADSSPDDVLLMIGTNDCGYDYANNLPLNTQYVIKVPTAVFQLDPKAHLYWSLIPPSPQSPGINNLVLEYNSQITSDVLTLQAEGENVTLVDNYTPFLNMNGSINMSMFGDNVHPSQTGYNVIGNDFAAAVPEPCFSLILGLGCVLYRKQRFN